MPQPAAPLARPDLFDTVPADRFAFGHGLDFDAKRVSDMLGLSREDIARLASVAATSVRYDAAMPQAMRERLEEIAMTVNWVAELLDGDASKAACWFEARNPLLGDVSPCDMIRLGRFERLRRFVFEAMAERQVAPAPAVARN